MNQVRSATNEIKTEIQRSVDTKKSRSAVGKELKNQVDKVKEDFDELTDSIKETLDFTTNHQPSLMGSSNVLTFFSQHFIIKFFESQSFMIIIMDVVV